MGISYTRGTTTMKGRYQGIHNCRRILSLIRACVVTHRSLLISLPLSRYCSSSTLTTYLQLLDLWVAVQVGRLTLRVGNWDVCSSRGDGV